MVVRVDRAYATVTASGEQGKCITTYSEVEIRNGPKLCLLSSYALRNLNDNKSDKGKLNVGQRR